ncbi:MAG: flagellar motor switch protein FliM [Opitutaceae bacterium]
MAGESQGGEASIESLSQAEIDQMLAESVASAAEPQSSREPVYRHAGERFDAKSLPGIEPHDFANPMVVSDIVMRALRQRHEEFARLVSARLALFLRMDFSLTLQRISTLVYRRFTADVSNPSHVVLFKVEPLAGVGVIDLNPQLGLAIVDRMLGGKGQLDGATEGLTEIEINLLDDVVQVMLEEWCRMWGGDRRHVASTIGRENGGRYLQTSANDTVMLVSTFECAFGEYTERVQIALPFPSLEGVVRNMLALMPASAGSGEERRPMWTQAYNNIPLPLSVEWDARDMTVREVLELRKDSVVRLPADIIQKTKVRLSGVAKFAGEIGLEADRLAIRIDKKLSPEDV